MPILIVMRLANMRRVHPQQDNSRTCKRCGESVGVYPSGQHIIAHCPETELVCDVCFERVDCDVLMLAPGAAIEPFESVKKESE